jgi:hypothetical protein
MILPPIIIHWTSKPVRLGLEESGGMVRVGPVHYNQAPDF